MVAIKVGIIGGTGLKDIELFIMEEEQQLSTPFGDPSSPLTCGKMHGIDCVLLSRHGKKHNIMPSCVNFRANIYALKMVGCTHIIVTTACGSLREEIKPGHVVILDQFIDFTKSRKSTFYGGQPGDLPGVCHIPMQKPFNEEVRKILMESCKENNVHFHEKGTAITIEGPRFSTYAESQLFRQWGASIINMTTVPEVVLANEIGIMYAALALVTDYDCWKNDCEAVNVEDVMKTLTKNVRMAVNVISTAIKLIAKKDWDNEIEAAKKVSSTAVM
ncbi:S-methyl-5'-thioadenosine phosphorylase-like [Clavelina lepadiformis]|uniref:S-methyl-5'-thioadenosine phosphorylase n=1 Tax=Clavelina lepadiformis TaxID=159417 RepID=A0ABP0FDI2_CLALP